MPLPRAMDSGDAELAVTGPFAPRWSRCGDPERLQRAADRLQADVQRQTGLILDGTKPTPIEIFCRSSAWAADQGEGYRLEIGRQGLRVDAEGPMGVIRAFATLRQLVGLSPHAIALPTATIEDAPRFGWRGLLIDVARHFMSVAALKRQIDAMERVKLNVLHLHFSDDQGFRVQSRLYPRLTDTGEFYTQDDIRGLVAYAADRGIRIVPEFDVPGHSRAIVTAYPEVGVVAPKGAFGISDVALNPAAPATYRFLERLFTEMAALFPDRYFHVGGDEVAAGVWDHDAGVQTLMKREGLADKKAVEGYFHRRVHAIMKRLNKVMIGWEEVNGSRLPDDVVIQVWQSSNATAEAAARHPTIVSAGYYLDLLMPADFHYSKDPLDPSAAGLAPDHAAGLRKLSPILAKIVTDAQVAFPRPPLSREQEENVLGAEAALWSEIVTEELLDMRLWPRSAALAERFWSPSSVRDTADMYRRLAIVGDLLSVTGLEDRSQRLRMAMRLAPGDAEAVEALLSVTGPVRNMAHDHRIKAMLAGRTIVQPLNALADAAPVDSLIARGFAADAERYASGDRSMLPTLRATLLGLRDNEARFARAAAGRPLLAPATATAAQIAALARAGLDAIDAIETGKAPDPAAVAAWRTLLDEVAAQEAASVRPFDAFLKAQPPADLIVKIGPAVRALVDRATMPR